MKRWPIIALGVAGIAIALWMVPRPDLDPDTGVADPSTVQAPADVEVLVEADAEPGAPIPNAGDGSATQRTRADRPATRRDAERDRSEAIAGNNPLVDKREDSPQVSASRKVVSSLEAIHRKLSVEHKDTESASGLRDIAGELRLAWRHAEDIDWDGMIPRMEQALATVEQSSAYGQDASLQASVAQARERLTDLRSQASGQ